jgi:hypothetical protein
VNGALEEWDNKPRLFSILSMVLRGKPRLPFVVLDQNVEISETALEKALSLLNTHKQTLTTLKLGFESPTS